MARKRISLSQFRIEGEWHEAIADLVHRYRQCDWSEDVYGMTPRDVVSAARSHAHECDGQPRPASAGLVPPALSEQLMAALTEGIVSHDASLETYLAEFGARSAS